MEVSIVHSFMDSLKPSEQFLAEVGRLTEPAGADYDRWVRLCLSEATRMLVGFATCSVCHRFVTMRLLVQSVVRAVQKLDSTWAFGTRSFLNWSCRSVNCVSVGLV